MFPLSLQRLSVLQALGSNLSTVKWPSTPGSVFGVSVGFSVPASISHVSVALG